MKQRTRAIVSAIVGLAVGVAYPFIDVYVRCRAPGSESCVWAKAFFMLTVAVSVPLIGAVAAAAAYIGIGWFTRRETPPSDEPQ